MWDSYFETPDERGCSDTVKYIHPTLCGIVILRHWIICYIKPYLSFLHSSHTMWDSYFETTEASCPVNSLNLYSSHTMWDSYFETLYLHFYLVFHYYSSHTMWDSYFETNSFHNYSLC